MINHFEDTLFLSISNFCWRSTFEDIWEYCQSQTFELGRWLIVEIHFWLRNSPIKCRLRAWLTAWQTTRPAGWTTPVGSCRWRTADGRASSSCWPSWGCVWLSSAASPTPCPPWCWPTGSCGRQRPCCCCRWWCTTRCTCCWCCLSPPSASASTCTTPPPSTRRWWPSRPSASRCASWHRWPLPTPQSPWLLRGEENCKIIRVKMICPTTCHPGLAHHTCVNYLSPHHPNKSVLSVFSSLCLTPEDRKTFFLFTLLFEILLPFLFKICINPRPQNLCFSFRNILHKQGYCSSHPQSPRPAFFKN